MVDLIHQLENKNQFLSSRMQEVLQKRTTETNGVCLQLKKGRDSK